mgnify:CR=1 FL=1
MLLESPLYPPGLFPRCEAMNIVFDAIDISSHSKEHLVDYPHVPESGFDSGTPRKTSKEQELLCVGLNCSRKH